MLLAAKCIFGAIPTSSPLQSSRLSFDYLLQISTSGGWMRNMLRAPDSHVYICGDALMANSVTAAVTQVIGEPPQLF